MAKTNGPLRLAMVGGGPGAFIGPVHLKATGMDRRYELVAGAFSRDPARNAEAGAGYNLPADRVHADWRDLLVKEKGNVDVVCVVTPNDTHFPISKAALEAGFAVMCDKPATLNLDEALALRDVIRKTGGNYGLTYTYSGYPLVREAKALVAQGKLGKIRKIVVEYPQGWLSQDVHSKQADWRVDPKQAGLGGCIGDIGVHAFHLAEFITGLRVTELCADLGKVVPGRALDDDCDILLRFDNEARGALIASQISAGERNALRIRVYGELGGLDWSQETPNTVTLNYGDRPTEVLHAGGGYLSPEVQAMIRIPAGHPEGYLEAFANIYRDFADQISGGGKTVPGIDDGVRGMHFVAVAVESSNARQWRMLKEI